MSNPEFKFDHLHIISNDPEASAKLVCRDVWRDDYGEYQSTPAPQIFVDLGGMTILIRGQQPSENPAATRPINSKRGPELALPGLRPPPASGGGLTAWVRTAALYAANGRWRASRRSGASIAAPTSRFTGGVPDARLSFSRSQREKSEWPQKQRLTRKTSKPSAPSDWPNC